MARVGGNTVSLVERRVHVEDWPEDDLSGAVVGHQTTSVCLAHIRGVYSIIDGGRPTDEVDFDIALQPIPLLFREAILSAAQCEGRCTLKGKEMGPGQVFES